MAYDSKKVILGEWQDVTGDTDRDALICAMLAVERREGERLGWDKPPRLWTFHLHDMNTRAVEIRKVPSRAWLRGKDNPVDDLTATATSMPRPPSELPLLRWSDVGDGLAAVAFMYEAWAAPMNSFTPEQMQQMEAGERLSEYSDQRREMRGVVAVDINNRAYILNRNRGEEPTLMTEGLDTEHSEMFQRGRAPQALRRIAYAARAGTWPR